MRVLFIVPYPTEGASNRYRVEQYLPFLKAHGVEYCLRSFITSKFYKILYKDGHYLEKVFCFILALLRRLTDIFRSSKFDIIFIHREACSFGPPIFEWIFAKLGKPIVFDFDDAIYLPTPNMTGRVYKFLKCFGKIAAIIKLSKHVIVCNDYLKQYVEQYNHDVSVIPTSVDTDRFKPRDSVRAQNRLEIGWIGSHTTSPYLQILTEVFQKLSQKYDFLFRIIGAGRQISIPGVDVENKDWNLSREVEDFQNLDIGVYPLLSNEWDLGKTGFKTVQYMATGIPAVVSKVGSNLEIVKDGTNGLLASKQEEWIEKISILIERSDFRKKLGEEGRRTVEAAYSVNANAPKLLKVLEQVYNSKNK